MSAWIGLWADPVREGGGRAESNVREVAVDGRRVRAAHQGAHPPLGHAQEQHLCQGAQQVAMC